MTNPLKVLLIAAVAAAFWAGEAQAMALNRCVRIVTDPQVHRETAYNGCDQCVVVKVERRRPGNESGTPTLREFTLLPGSSLPLPFQGPGQSRITSEMPCPGAPRAGQ